MEKLITYVDHYFCYKAKEVLGQLSIKIYVNENSICGDDLDWHCYCHIIKYSINDISAPCSSINNRAYERDLINCTQFGEVE